MNVCQQTDIRSAGVCRVPATTTETSEVRPRNTRDGNHAAPW